MLTDNKSYHAEAVMTDDFIREVFDEIRGINKTED